VSDLGSALEVEVGLERSLLDVGPTRSLLSDAWRRFRRNRLALFGLVLVIFLLLVAIFGPFLVSDPSELHTSFKEPPTNQFPFGTDELGRDVLARVVYGIRLSMFIGVTTTAIETIFGVMVGAVAGWFGKWTDTVLMRFVDIMLGIPYILFAFALIAVYGKGVSTVIFALAITAWLGTARVVRAGFLQARELEYVDAARVLGVSPLRIMWRHILPNVFQPLVIYIAVGVGAAVLGEAALSFLGVGVPPDKASLGGMIEQSSSLFSEAPHLLFFPAFSLVLTVLGFLLVGDGLRDALDVKDL